VAGNAGQAILVTYQLAKDLDNLERWAIKIRDARCAGEPANAEGVISAAGIARADEQMKQGRFAAAARRYMAVVEQYPRGKDAPLALNNAAVAMERTGRLDSASRLYQRLWHSYPDSPHAPNALWRTAVNDHRTFEFQRAVTSYLNLAQSPRYSGFSGRADAIWNAAVLLENDQRYGEAARWFLKYAKVRGATKEAAEAYFRAGLVQRKMGDIPAMASTFKTFIRRYSRVAGQEQRMVEALFRLAEHQDVQRKDWRGASRLYSRVIGTWRLHGARPAGDDAEFAARAAFRLADKEQERFQLQRLGGSLRTIQRQEERLAARATKLRRAYQEIWGFGKARWTLAAMFRAGTVFEHFARTTNMAYSGAPVPAQVRRLGSDAVELYRKKLEELLVARVDPLVRQATSLYSACLEKARELGVSNQYTEQAHRRLHAYDRKAYPMIRRAKVAFMVD